MIHCFSKLDSQRQGVHACLLQCQSPHDGVHVLPLKHHCQGVAELLHAVQQGAHVLLLRALWVDAENAAAAAAAVAAAAECQTEQWVLPAVKEQL